MLGLAFTLLSKCRLTVFLTHTGVLLVIGFFFLQAAYPIII